MLNYRTKRENKVTVNNKTDIKETLKEHNIPLSEEINKKIEGWAFEAIVEVLQNLNKLNRSYLLKLLAFDRFEYSRLRSAIIKLEVYNLLSPENIDTIFTDLEHAEQLADAIVLLHNAKTDSAPYLAKLTPDNIDFAPGYVTFLLALEKSSIEDEIEEYETSFLRVVKKDHEVVANILMMLAEAKILKDNFYSVVNSHHLSQGFFNAFYISKSLSKYHRKGVLNQQTFNTVLNADEISVQTNFIAQIHSCFLIGVLDDAEYKSIKENPYKIEIVGKLILEDLEKNGALTRKNFTHIYRNIPHILPDEEIINDGFSNDLEQTLRSLESPVLELFKWLYEIGLATQINQDLILQHYPNHISQLEDFKRALSQLVNYNPSVIIGEKLGRNVLKLPQKDFNELYSVVFGENGSEERHKKFIFDPRSAKLEKHPRLKLRTLTIEDGGRSLSDGPIILKRILREQSLLINQEKATFNKINTPESKETDEVQLVKEDLATYVKNLKFQGILGRTLLFKDQDTSNIIAIKIRKKGEDISELRKEYTTASELRKHKGSLGLKSEIPNPKAIMQLNHVRDYLMANSGVHSDAFATFENLVGEFENGDNLDAYVYEAKDDYFTYLHETMSYKEYFHANEVIVHDLCVLLKNGLVYDRLADIFHNTENSHDNREDRGRYQILVDLLRPDFFLGGDGRITAWQKAVEYPNVRKSGLADLGDWRLLETVLDSNSDFVKEFIPNLFSAANTEIEAQNSIIADFLAEYMLVLQLIAGRRALEVTKGLSSDSEQAHHIWRMIAKQMILNCAIAMSIMSDIPEDIAIRYLEQSIDLNRYAQQMKFWMTNEFVSWVNEKKLPTGLYAPELEIKFGDIRHDTWDPKIGSSIDGVNPDLGAVNGQNPIKEGSKLFYHMLIGTFLGKEVSDSFSMQQGYKNLTMFAHANADKDIQRILQPDKNSEAIARIQRIYRENKHKKMKLEMMERKVENLESPSMRLFSPKQSTCEENPEAAEINTPNTKSNKL